MHVINIELYLFNTININKRETLGLDSGGFSHGKLTNLSISDSSAFSVNPLSPSFFALSSSFLNGMGSDRLIRVE